MSTFTSTILITGGTTGLGCQTASILAQETPATTRIVVASRTDKDNVAKTINEKLKSDKVTFRKLDLSNLTQIREFVEDWKKDYLPPISALLLNAAIQVHEGLQYTADGIETTFGVNHVGHALLLELLKPQLTPNARIVFTASGTHDSEQRTGMPKAFFNNAEELAHPTGEALKVSSIQRYPISKLANVLYTHALDHRLNKSSTNLKNHRTVNAFDPGLMPGTGLGRNAIWPLRFIWEYVLPNIIPLLRLVAGSNIHTAAESGTALAALAISNDFEGVTGKYFEGTKETPASKDSHDISKQDNLWTWTENYLARTPQEKEQFSEW